MTAPRFYCDRCRYTVSQAEAVHHRDAGHSVIELELLTEAENGEGAGK